MIEWMILFRDFLEFIPECGFKYWEGGKVFFQRESLVDDLKAFKNKFKIVLIRLFEVLGMKKVLGTLVLKFVLSHLNLRLSLQLEPLHKSNMSNQQGRHLRRWSHK